MKPSPLISVCIPVFDTESYLAQCLKSVINQNFESFEIIVVSDASRGRDEAGRNAKKIVKLAQKEADKIRREKGLPHVQIRYFEHHENRGILEVRRTLVYEARGTYIAMIDSDDEFLEDALSSLYTAAVENNSDIVHGTFISGFYNQNNEFVLSENTKCGKIFYGSADASEIMTKWLKGFFAGNLCGKLILKSILEKSFDFIPYTECNMADDVLIFFYVAINASRYLGIETKIYRYRINSGMTSTRKIDSLQKWRLICSASSVFTVISEWIKENPGKLSEEEVNHIRKMTSYYLLNNLQQLKETVIPELQPAARQMLCDYWGKSFVERLDHTV